MNRQKSQGGLFLETFGSSIWCHSDIDTFSSSGLKLALWIEFDVPRDQTPNGISSEATLSVRKCN